MANENKGKNESNNNLVYFFLITALHLSMIELHLDFSAHRPSFNDQSIIILLPHFNRFTPSWWFSWNDVQRAKTSTLMQGKLERVTG